MRLSPTTTIEIVKSTAVAVAAYTAHTSVNV